MLKDQLENFSIAATSNSFPLISAFAIIFMIKKYFFNVNFRFLIL
jgi:hypothetical protein